MPGNAPPRLLPIATTIVGLLSAFAPMFASAQPDPNRYRPDQTFNGNGFVVRQLGSAVGQDFRHDYRDRAAGVLRTAPSQTYWVFGGSIISNGDLLMRAEALAVNNQGGADVEARREWAGWRSFGGVVPSNDGSIAYLQSSLIGRPSDAAITQLRASLGAFPATSCNGSFQQVYDFSGAGSRDDLVLGSAPAANAGTYAVGTFDVGGGEFRAFIARFGANCALDGGFNGSGWRAVDAFLGIFPPARRVRFNDVAVDITGRAVAVGGVMYSTGALAEGNCIIARFNANGSLDNSFDGDGILVFDPSTPQTTAARCDFTDVAIDSQNRILVLAEVEDANDPSPLENKPGVVVPMRFNNDGSLSSTFGRDFNLFFSPGERGAGLAVLDNGDIVYGRNGLSGGSFGTAVDAAAIALDPNTGGARWSSLNPLNRPFGQMSALADIVAELGSGIYFTGFTGSTRFNLTNGVLARYTFGQRYTVQVNRNGTGTGTITSSPAGMNCNAITPNQCFLVVDAGSSVTLTATPGAGSYFADWGLPACAPGPTCTFTVNNDVTLATRFEPNTLSVQRFGTDGANGTVTSAPVGINCGTTCSANFTSGTDVTLTATPDAGAIFLRWGGEVPGTCLGNPQCVVPLSNPRNVTALFAPATQTLNVTLNGFGLVTSTPAGINCGSTCSAAFGTGSTVTLLAQNPPFSNFAFANWGGDAANCGANPQCLIPMNALRNVTANFPQRQIAVTVTTTGNGTVSSSPAGISGCSGSCTNNFGAGSLLTLTATPGPGQRFVGWSADAAICGSNPICTLQPSNPITASAAFAPLADEIFRSGFEP
jgi:hypothetical protein